MFSRFYLMKYVQKRRNTKLGTPTVFDNCLKEYQWQSLDLVFLMQLYVKKPPHFYVFLSPTFFSQWSSCFISSSVAYGENPGPPTGYSELKTKATYFPSKEAIFSRTEIYCFIIQESRSLNGKFSTDKTKTGRNSVLLLMNFISKRENRTNQCLEEISRTGSPSRKPLHL